MTKTKTVDVRETIVRAALPHVAFDGWTEAVLRLGAKDAGLSPSRADIAFPEGPVEAIEYLAGLADLEMVRALVAREDWSTLKVREKIYWAVRTRLEQWPEEREALRRAASVLAMPQNATTALHITAATVDAMWKVAGDKSVDYNWYTKRASLGAIYTATVLYWLNDASEGFADTWDFLERRIEDILKVPQVQNRVLKELERLPNPFKLFAERKTPFGM